MSEGYSHATITGRTGGSVRIDSSLYLDQTAQIRLLGADKGRPFLSLDHGGVTVFIGPRIDKRLTDTDVAAFRRLAEETARLLAEVERLHTQQNNHDDQAA